MLNKPIITVKKVTLMKMSNTSQKSGRNGISKLKVANAQADVNAIKIPTIDDSAPRKKYSNAVIANICLLLAPNVLSKTLS